MKKLVHVKSLITLALCLMMCFTFFAPASTVQAKKRVVDNVFMQNLYDKAVEEWINSSGQH